MTDTWSEDAGVLESPFPGRAAPAGEDLDERWFRGGVVESPFVAAPARAGQAPLSLEAELPQPAATLPRPDGIDVYSGNALPAAGAIRRAGISFVLHKSSERTKRGPLIHDPKFGDRWAQSRADGFIRGSYHYYRHCDGASGEQQADLVVAQVQRLGPGDLAPSLDLENDSVVTGSAKAQPGCLARGTRIIPRHAGDEAGPNTPGLYRWFGLGQQHQGFCGPARVRPFRWLPALAEILQPAPGSWGN